MDMYIISFILGISALVSGAPTEENSAPFFEGIDWNLHPENLVHTTHDCYEHMIRCIRARPMHYPVCGYNKDTSYYKNYNGGVCEIELLNCYNRVDAGLPITGTGFLNNDYIFHNGEGYDCQHYLDAKPVSAENYRWAGGK